MEKEQREAGLAHLAEAQNHWIKSMTAVMVGAIAASVELPVGLIFVGVAAYQFKKMQDEFNAAKKIAEASKETFTLPKCGSKATGKKL